MLKDKGKDAAISQRYLEPPPAGRRVFCRALTGNMAHGATDALILAAGFQNH